MACMFFSSLLSMIRLLFDIRVGEDRRRRPMYGPGSAPTSAKLPIDRDCRKHPPRVGPARWRTGPQRRAWSRRFFQRCSDCGGAPCDARCPTVPRSPCRPARARAASGSRSRALSDRWGRPRAGPARPPPEPRSRRHDRRVPRRPPRPASLPPSLVNGRDGAAAAPRAPDRRPRRPGCARLSPHWREARRADSRRRRAARDPKKTAAPAHATATDSTRSVTCACERTLSHSPTSSGPGLSQIAFATLILPRSWSRPANSMRSRSASGRLRIAAARRASAATPRECPRVKVDFKSTKSASTSATSRR